MATISFTINAGPHDRRYAPVAIDLPEALRAAGKGGLTRCDTGKAIPTQTQGGQLHFIIDKLVAGQQVGFTFDTDGQSARAARVVLDHDEMKRQINIRVGRKPFTTYCYDAQVARPHFYPLLGPGGVQITRSYPMVENVPGEPTDHIHHRSAWVAYGDVNGSDNWSEEEGHGWQTHRALGDVISGPVFGQFQQQLDWEDHHHRPQLQEVRTVRIYNTPDTTRLMDLTVALRPIGDDVRLGDTKEGGICSVRVATSMDGDKGGQIENSIGGLGEAETWGRPAHWCDYSGHVTGSDGQSSHVGIAIFDHPFNLRYPTPWHVRDYGLMTANPFAHAAYQSGLMTDGSYTISAGETLTFRYRMYFHKYDARKGQVGARYHDYVNPPMAQGID